MTIRPVGAQFFHAEGRTDRHDEANSRFSQLCEKRPQTEFTRTQRIPQVTEFVK